MSRDLDLLNSKLALHLLCPDVPILIFLHFCFQVTDTRDDNHQIFRSTPLSRPIKAGLYVCPSVHSPHKVSPIRMKFGV